MFTLSTRAYLWLHIDLLQTTASNVSHRLDWITQTFIVNWTVNVNNFNKCIPSLSCKWGWQCLDEMLIDLSGGYDISLICRFDWWPYAVEWNLFVIGGQRCLYQFYKRIFSITSSLFFTRIYINTYCKNVIYWNNSFRAFENGLTMSVCLSCSLEDRYDLVQTCDIRVFLFFNSVIF